MSLPTAGKGKFEEQFKDEIDRVARNIYSKQRGLKYDERLLKATAEKLMESVKKGFGKIDEEWDSPNREKYRHLTQNVYSFSAAKNYHQLKDMTEYMVEERDGEKRMRSFSDFRRGVDEMNLKYNKTWLETEYITAEHGAASAAQWAQYEAEADIFPMLKYQTVGDNRVREAHRLLDGTIKHIRDDFWKTYFPPNGWRCRCEAIQVPESYAEEREPEGIPYVQPLFKTNLGEQGLIFPKGHVYYKDTPRAVLEVSMKYLPADACFKSRKAGKAVINESLLATLDGLKVSNMVMDSVASELGKDMFLLPEYDLSQPELRKRLIIDFLDDMNVPILPDVRDKRKCPDGFIAMRNGWRTYDFKGVSGSQSSIYDGVRDCNKKANVLIIHNLKEYGGKVVELDLKRDAIVDAIKKINRDRMKNIECFIIKAIDGVFVVNKGDLR